MLGDGNSINLLKLFLVVKEKGGYESVSKDGLWGLVAEEIGLGCDFGCSLKLTYVEHLDTLETLLQSIVQKKGSKGCLKDPGMSRDAYLMEIGPQFQEKGLDSLLTELRNEDLNFTGGEDICSKNEVCSGESDNLKNKKEGDVEISSDTSVNVSNRKRKRESNQRMLHWVLEVAKDPCNLRVEPLPESPKWKRYGNEQIWKQVLLAREDMIQKRTSDLSNAIWRTKQKMHPSMYDDYSGSQSLRSSKRVQVKDSQLLNLKHLIPRLCLDSPSGTHSDSGYHFNKESSPFSEDSVLNLSGNEHKCVRVGPLYQAYVPEYTEETYVADTKRLGSCVWPLENEENSQCHQIKKTRNGGKVQDLCKCRNSGSDQCVQYHINMKRKRLKLELGPAFNHWGFDKMGKQVSLSWTKEDEKRFQEIIESNPHSLGVCFWDEMFKSFPRKSREDLVSYYFNVFVLQRRGLQNRSNERDIDSDGEESEYGPLSRGFGRVAVNSPASIFHSPKKAYLKTS